LAQPKTRILLVEDDDELSALIAEYLAENEFEVHVVSDGAQAEASVRSLSPALVILDLMLPGRDGLQICRDLRVWFRGPILLLTARSGWVDEIVGLEIGADEYLGKPVEPRLLLARIRNLLRRGTSYGPTTGAVGLEVDEARRSAKLGGRTLELTDAEFDLLAYLVAHEGQQLTRSQISEDVCDTAYDGLGRGIDVRIGRLRNKLGDDAKQPRWIKAVRGVGYLFVEPKD